MRSNGKKNVTPLSAPYSKSVRRFAPLKVGERNKVSGTMGAGRRASTRRKASRATTPRASAPSTSAVPKPREPASISPYTSAPNPSVTSSVPPQSSPPFASGSRLSGTRQNRTPSTTAASGTLRKKTQRQEAYCTNTPPSTGPTTVVSAENPDQVPIARPRCSSLKEALIIARLPGTSKAAPIPCTARARISESTVGERPPQMEARVKTAMRRRVDAPPPKVIAQGSSHQNERRQEERIGFHNPLHIAGGGAQVSLDDRQG